MPAFDPVRDAVLNSPLFPSGSGPPHHTRMHIDLPAAPHEHNTTSPGSTSSHPTLAYSDSSPSRVSTPITRRATDLSVLLNFDPPPQDTPLFTPTTPRASATLSHLLLPTEDVDERDQLTDLAPLRRRSSGYVSGSSSTARENSYFSWPSSSTARSSASIPDSPQASTSLALPGTLPTPQASSPPLIRSPVVAPTLSNIMTPTNASSPHTSRPSSSPSRPSTATAPGASASRPSALQRGGNVNGNGRTPAMLPPPTTPSPRSTSFASTPQVEPPPPRAAMSSPKRPVTSSPATPPLRQHSASVPRPGPAATSASSHPPSSLPSKPPTTSDSDTMVFSTKRSSVPYAPTRRRTPAGSVLIPLSPAEMERYRNFPGGVGTMMLRKRKREQSERQDAPVKRERSGEENDDEGGGQDREAKRRKIGDVGLVVEHYNARPDVGVTQRQESPIIGLKSFNNWVKSVLITRFAHPALAESPIAPAAPEPGRGGRGQGGASRGRVLDMGCGKGGDLTKWSKARVREYIGVDIAAISVDQARLRHASMRSGPRFAASFFALDCYTHALRDALPPALFDRPLDVVSMQFCMHYAFESESKARCMLANVAGNLRPGGVFIGTIPNAEQLLERLDALPRDSEDLSFGNSVYTIRFEERTQRPLFGHRYWFFLKDAVDDVPEYIVQWDNFARMAAEYGLHVVYKKEFHHIFEEHRTNSEFGALLERMRVVDGNGESQMDEDQWEAANIYIGFALEKR